MVVYVEYVFLDNFIIDIMLISLARQSFKLEVKKSRICLSALVGAVFAVVSPLFSLPIALSFALKMPMGLAIVVCSGKFRSFKEYLKCFYLFLFFTFLLGGVVTAIFWGFGFSFDPINYAHGGEIPLFIILIIVFLVYLFAKKIVKEIYKRKVVTNFLVKCKIESGGKIFEFLGFLDSGNSLCYKPTGSPIILCSQKMGEKLKKESPLLNFAYDVVTVNTVSGKSVVPIYKIEKFWIYNGENPNILYNVMLGVIKGGFTSGDEYDLLLSPLVGGV